MMVYALSYIKLQLLCLIAVYCIVECQECSVSDSTFPSDHIQYYSRGQGHGVAKQDESEGVCNDKKTCKVKTDLKGRPCWGYENNCHINDRYSTPTCSVHHSQWATSLEHQKDIFYDQGDFGYVRNLKEQLMDICTPKQPNDSSLKCSKNMAFCHAKNLYLDLRNLNSKNSINRYSEDVIKHGDIGGHCDFNEKLLKSQGERKSPLQSWYAELEHFSNMSFNPLSSGNCDVVIDRPTILIKLDAGVNMYHHFCDFVNLYATQHLNGSFSTDINIIMWDTSPMHYHDFFADTWKAFTRHPIIRLDKFDGKKVCFKDAVFSLLARMVFGLYYNMPLVPDCQGSGLFKAFSHHTLHRLGIKQIKRKETRITLLVRRTKYRRILNEDELSKAIRSVPNFDLNVVDYNHNMPFLQQLNQTHNSDIFIGIHGSGLTHLLFLPDWAVVFELYNTEDPDCYKDLANLRGVTYMTWENKDKLFQQDEGHHPTMGAHAKFTNYAFNVDEFMRMIFKAAELVHQKKSL